MEELKNASRFKVGGLATVGAMTIKQAPLDRRRGLDLEEERLKKRQEQEEERLKKQLQQEEEQQRLEAQWRLEQEEAMIMRELEEQEEALQRKMEELKNASRFKVGGLAAVGAMTIKQTPADRRRARRMEFTNEEENDMEELRAKIAEAERMLMEETQDDVLLDESFVSKKKNRKKKAVLSESQVMASASASIASTPPSFPTPSKKLMASEGTIRRLPRQFSSATIPSLNDSLLDVEGGDNNSDKWAVPIIMRKELLEEEDGSIDPSTLPNLAKQKHPNSSGISNKQSKSSGDIPRHRKTQDTSSEASTLSVPSYLPSTSNRYLFSSNSKQQQAQQLEASLDIMTLPNLSVERHARKQQDALATTGSKPFWAAIGGRPIVMSSSDSQNGSGDVSTLKSNLLPNSFHESDINGLSSDSGETSSTPSLVKNIASAQGTVTQPINELSDELPDLKSISEGSMSESSSESSSGSSSSDGSRPDDASATNSSTTSSLPSAVPSNAPSATASATPSYIVEERVEHAEGSRGPWDRALKFSDSFVKNTSPQNLLPSRTESLESEMSEFPRFFRGHSRRNLGVLSEAGDVFTDDVSLYSLERFNTMGFDSVADITSFGTPRSGRVLGSAALGTSKGSGADVGSGSPDRRAELVRQLSQHTTVCSADGAGDIHVGATVRFGGDLDLSDDQSSSDDSDDITLDSELQADELRYDGFRRHVPEMKKDTRRRSLSGCIRSSINAIKIKSRCVGYWTCRDKKQAMKRRPKLEKRLSSRKCLLHTEEETYDRSHVLSGSKQDQRRQSQRLSGIDEDGFMVAYESNQ
jgi:hypothetical protein